MSRQPGDGVHDGADEVVATSAGALGGRLEAAILDLLARRAPSATICPSEAARAVGGDDWRPLMDQARAAARRLSERGSVVVVQDGRPVDPATARGPVRIRRA
jgi:hypothetical protein